MQSLVSLPLQGSDRIKEELILLLSYFLMTFELRTNKIKKIITKNAHNLHVLINQIAQNNDNEEMTSIYDTII